MIVAVAALLLLAAFLARPATRYLALHRRARRDDPVWWAQWDTADRETKRRVTMALRRGETLLDPAEARLVVGLGRAADGFKESAGRRARRRLPLLLVAVAGAFALGDVAVGVEALIALAFSAVLLGVILPRQRRLRDQAIAANRAFLGEGPSSSTIDR
jgi:hypothetical protein